MSDNSGTQNDNLILPTFLMMFLDVADLIFEKMSPMDLLTTRKVSRGLRTAVDEFRIRFDEIRVSTYGYCRTICIYFNETGIEYESCCDGGMNVMHEEKTWKIDEENYVERALKDLKLVMLSNYIKFSLEEHVEEPYEACPYVNAFTHFIAWLESENSVQVEYIRLSGFIFDKVLTILPYFDAEALQVIHLCDTDQIEQFERITHLDQWTNDIKFILEDSQFNFDRIEHLFQIKSFKISVDELSVQDAIKIRDDLMKISTFDSCEITFDASKIHRNDIANVFALDSTRRYPWMWKYSNDKYKFWTRITVHYGGSKYRLYVKRIENSKMQQNNLMLPSSPNLPLDAVDLVAQKLEHMHRSSPQISKKGSKTQVKGELKPSLLNMPLDVADLVFEKMERVDLLRTRKVCRGFRAAVDRFGVRFDRIDFTMKDDCIKMGLDVECCFIYLYADSSGTTDIEDGNFLEMIFNDLKLALKCAPSLYIFNETEETEDMIITSFLDFLEIEECIHVKRIHFVRFSYDDVIAILPYCDAQTLEGIWVVGNGSSKELKAIFNLDQWKLAKRFVLQEERFEMKLFEHLFHFEEFKIEHCELSVQNAIKIRDDLMRRSTFKNCRIQVSISETTEVFEIAKVFKPDVDSKESYDFEYSNETGRFKIGIGEYDDCPWPLFIVIRL